MLLLTLTVLLIFFLYLKLSKIYSYWTDRGVKQRKQIYLLGDNGTVILGKESFCDVVAKIYNSFPDERYVGIYQGMLPTLMVKDPDLIKKITIKDFDHFTDHRQLAPDGVDPLWTRSLLTLKGDEWRHMRATLSPSFTSAKMKMIFNLMLETAETYLEYFKNRDVKEMIELKDLFTRFTNDVIATVAFGIKCDSINERTNDFYEMGKQATTFTLKRNLIVFSYMVIPKISKAIGLNIFPERTTNFFKKIITDAIKFREEQGIERPDMIHLLLEARKDGFVLTDEDIVSQAFIFLFGGFETVSSLMCFMGYELAINPDVQKRLQEEIDHTINQCTDGKLTYEALTKMKYLDMVTSETLRKWPLTITDRVCTNFYKIEPNSNEREVLLQPDDIVWIPISAIHRDPKYYPNPEKFDPERFNEKNKEKIKPYTYFPFGVGPRNCIGSRLALLEVKVIFFQMLQHFSFVVNEKTEIPLKISKTSANFLSENGVWVNITPRI